MALTSSRAVNFCVGPASFLLCEVTDTPEHLCRGAWAGRAV